MSIVVAVVAVLAITALAFLAVTRPTMAARRRMLAGVLIIALAGAGARVGGLHGAGSLVVGAGLLLLGIVLVTLAARGPGAPPPPATVAPADVRGRWLALHAVAVLLVLVSPHLHLLAAGAVLAAVAGGLAVRPTGGARPQAGQGVALLLLAGGWYALTLVGGEAPLWIGALHQAPYSEAFELSVALPLALAAWPWLGLFPFHDTRLGPLAPVVGGALLVRVVAEAVPIGLAHWQPVLYPLVLAAMVHALVRRRDTEALAALAALGLLSGAFLVGWCATGLAAGVSLLRAHALVRAAGRVLTVEGMAVAQASAVAAALLLVPVLSGGLASEAVYTVLVVLCGAIYLWKR